MCEASDDYPIPDIHIALFPPINMRKSSTHVRETERHCKPRVTRRPGLPWRRNIYPPRSEKLPRHSYREDSLITPALDLEDPFNDFVVSYSSSVFLVV